MIVFADGGGLTEHVEDARTGFVVHDQAGLNRRLAELVDDSDLRRWLGKAARKRVERTYTLEAMADRYDALYASASGARRSLARA